MSSNLDNETEQQPFNEASPSQKLEHLYHTDLSIISFLLSASQTALVLTFVAVTPLYGFAALDAFGAEYFPERIQQSTRESGLNVFVRLVYLAGPLIGVLSVGIFQFVKTLERIIRLRAVARRAADSPAGKLLNDTLSLQQNQIQLGDQVSNFTPGDPAYDAYREAAAEVDLKKRRLLGPTPVAVIAWLVLVIVNWYALGLQFYFGVQWGFFSNWLSIPVLAVWLVALLVCTVSRIRGGRDHIRGSKPSLSSFESSNPN